jgi:hypothetical protein
MYQHVQYLIDQVWEDTQCLSAPPPLNHPAMVQLLALPKNVVTPILLEMLSMDPSWIHLSALRAFHGEQGPSWPARDDGRMGVICGHWVQWGVARNHLGYADPDEKTDEA